MKKVIFLTMLIGIPLLTSFAFGGSKASVFSASGESYSDCLQRCFDQWSRNKGTCKSDHCTTILGIPISCDNGYQGCLVEARRIYDACVRECGGLAVAASVDSIQDEGLGVGLGGTTFGQ